MNTACARQPTIRPETYPIQEAAKMLAIGKKRLFQILRSHQVLYKDAHGNNMPYQQYIDRRYFIVKTSSWHHPISGTHLRASTNVTQAGMVWLSKKIPQWRAENVQH